MFRALSTLSHGLFVVVAICVDRIGVGVTSRWDRSRVPTTTCRDRAAPHVLSTLARVAVVGAAVSSPQVAGILFLNVDRPPPIAHGPRAYKYWHDGDVDVATVGVYALPRVFAVARVRQCVCVCAQPQWHSSTPLQHNLCRVCRRAHCETQGTRLLNTADRTVLSLHRTVAPPPPTDSQIA